MHTRYAPVRRSQVSKLTLPLDLHVLGLPLAFILSQDQTLHRIFLLFFDVLFKTFCRQKLLLFIFLLIQYVYELIFFFSLVSQSGCKSKTSFLFSQIYFENIFLVIFKELLRPVSFLKRIAKLQPFFNHFQIYFWKFFVVCKCFKERFLFFNGANIPTLFTNFLIISNLFLLLFFS